MRFVSRYVTIEVGSSFFEDLIYVLLCLMPLLFGIVVVSGLFKRSAPQEDPPPPATATLTVTMIETEQVRGDPRRGTIADPPRRTTAEVDVVPERVEQDGWSPLETDAERRRRMQIHIRGQIIPPVQTVIARGSVFYRSPGEARNSYRSHGCRSYPLCVQQEDFSLQRGTQPQA